MIVAFIVVAMAGAIGHEVAHWLVWTITGRRPQFHLRDLYVEPRVGPTSTTAGDRVAAAAPYVTGALSIVAGYASGVVLAMVFGIAMIGIPSRVDLATMRGNAEWELLST